MKIYILRRFFSIQDVQNVQCLSILSFLNIYSICLVVKIVEHINLVTTRTLYYSILSLSYIDLVLDKIVTLSLFFKTFRLESILSSSLNMSKVVSSSIRCHNAIAKRERPNRRVKIRTCQSCFARNLKCMITREFSRCIECERFNRKCDLTSSNKKMNKTLDVLKKLNNKILNAKTKAIRLRKQRKH